MNILTENEFIDNYKQATVLTNVVNTKFEKDISLNKIFDVFMMAINKYYENGGYSRVLKQMMHFTSYSKYYSKFLKHIDDLDYYEKNQDDIIFSLPIIAWNFRKNIDKLMEQKFIKKMETQYLAMILMIIFRLNNIENNKWIQNIITLFKKYDINRDNYVKYYSEYQQNPDYNKYDKLIQSALYNYTHWEYSNDLMVYNIMMMHKHIEKCVLLYDMLEYFIDVKMFFILWILIL